jgi:hypothetical protein
VGCLGCRPVADAAPAAVAVTCAIGALVDRWFHIRDGKGTRARGDMGNA